MRYPSENFKTDGPLNGGLMQDSCDLFKKTEFDLFRWGKWSKLRIAKGYPNAAPFAVWIKAEYPGTIIESLPDMSDSEAGIIERAVLSLKIADYELYNFVKLHYLENKTMLYCSGHLRKSYSYVRDLRRSSVNFIRGAIATIGATDY